MYGKIVSSALKSGDTLYTGVRHSDCFTQEPKGVLRGATQGFITTKGKFVDRKKALVIATHYNQIIKKHPPYDKLLSEDLW